MNLVIGISGASGVIMGKYLLTALQKNPSVTTHLVITDGARANFLLEKTGEAKEIEAMADFCYNNSDFAAPIASGTFPAAGMIVIPCSMKTVAGIACGFSDNLLLRAADVTLKENRPLVLVPREMPFSRLHLKNLKEVADYGATIIAPVLTFYNGADTVEKQIEHIIGKIMERFSLPYAGFRRWNQ